MFKVGKECGGKWFPTAGRGYWDGWHWFLTHPRRMINLKFRKFDDGFAIGPLMFWKDAK
jgi:hypothetical protein